MKVEWGSRISVPARTEQFVKRPEMGRTNKRRCSSALDDYYRSSIAAVTGYRGGTRQWMERVRAVRVHGVRLTCQGSKDRSCPDGLIDGWID